MALKECKECGKEVSTKADTCPNCGVKDPTTPLSQKVVTVLIGLLFFGWMCSTFVPDSDTETASTEQTTQEQPREDKEVNWEPVKDAISKAKESGFLTRTEKVDRTFYVNPVIWRAFNAESKENSVTVLARYMGYITGQDQAVGITVKDNQSGRPIAEYSIFSGVEIK